MRGVAMNFDDTAKFATPPPLPPPLRRYIVQRFGGLVSNWWELLTSKGWEYVTKYAAGETLPVAKSAGAPIEPKVRCANVFDDGARCRRSRESGKRYCERCAKMRKRESTRRSKAKTNLKEEIGPRKCLSANGRKSEFRMSATVTLGQAKTPQISPKGRESEREVSA
jgi:hypothetical protein